MWPTTFFSAEVDLREPLGELAGEDGVAAVHGEVGVVDAGAARRVDVVTMLHRLRIAEVEPLLGLLDHDGVLAVGREIHVVRVVHRDVLAGLARLRVDRREGSLVVRSALLVTQSVCMSHDGTTCCGLRPTLYLSMTVKVLGSIT
jgi:hypothetical protein